MPANDLPLCGEVEKSQSDFSGGGRCWAFSSVPHPKFA
jgi:hypothetical protein